jgi:hypothetical protein
VGKSVRKTSLGIPRYGLEDVIKVELKEIGLDVVD